MALRNTGYVGTNFGQTMELLRGFNTYRGPKLCHTANMRRYHYPPISNFREWGSDCKVDANGKDARSRHSELALAITGQPLWFSESTHSLYARTQPTTGAVRVLKSNLTIMNNINDQKITRKYQSCQCTLEYFSCSPKATTIEADHEALFGKGVTDRAHLDN